MCTPSVCKWAYPQSMFSPFVFGFDDPSSRSRNGCQVQGQVINSLALNFRPINLVIERIMDCASSDIKLYLLTIISTCTQ